VLDGVLRKLVSRSFKRGFAGEPVWIAVGAAAWLVVRSRNRDRPVVWSGRLEEGQSVTLTVRGSEAEARTTNQTD
jgi:hypothetical protein